MHSRWIKDRSLFIGFYFGFILLFQQSFAYATAINSNSSSVQSAALSTPIIEINGLKIAGNPASLKWIDERADAQSVWMDQLVEDKEIADLISIAYDENLFKKRQECPVCLEKLHKSETLIVSQCSHLFCKSCFDSIISDPYQDETSCPLCRKTKWSHNIISLKYTPGEAHDLVAKVESVDGILNSTPVEPDSRLGLGLTDSSGTTWYETVKEKKLIWSGFRMRRVQTDRVRWMNQNKAQSYCRKRGARLPNRADFQRLRRNMGAPISPELNETALWISSSISTAWFWSSEPVLGDPDRFYVYNGVESLIDLRSSDLKGAVLCVRP